MVKRGDVTHIIDKAASELAVKEQMNRQTSDPWRDPVDEWLSEQKSDFISTKDVWLYALRGREADLNLAHQRRIAGVLRDLGWEQHVRTKDAKCQRGWRMIGSEILM